MPPSLIEVEVVADRLAVVPDTTDWDDLVRLTAAVSSAIRRMTRRAFEGDEGGTYDEIIRLHGSQEFTLPNVPVQSVTSIQRVSYDGTADDAWPTTDWRLEDAARGRVSIRRGAQRVRVIYRTTGDIPEHISQAAADWIAARWAARPLGAGQTGYKTGEDAETWSAERVGRPPTDVAIALGLETHVTAAVV
jgi:hypothetical protein